MKMFYWTPYIGNVGTIKATINSAIIMRKAGHDVFLYKLCHEWEGYEELISLNGINIIDFKLLEKIKWYPKGKIQAKCYFILLSILCAGKLKQNLQEEKPDVVMLYLMGYLPLVVRGFLKVKPKMIASIQGKPKFHLVRKIIWKAFYRKADIIITLTEETRKDIVGQLNIPEHKVRVINNPIVDNGISDMAEKLYGIAAIENDDYIVGVGRLTKQKNFQLLLKAYAKCKYRNQYKLLIVGEGEEGSTLQKLATDLGIEERVIFTGFVRNPYYYMKNAGLFVLSSLWEDAGHVLIEAAYLKVPIVATKCPSGTEEFLEFGHAGYLCNNNDVNDMCKQMEKALNDKNIDITVHKVQRAYKNSLRYSWEQHGERLGELLDKLYKG